MLTEPVGRRGRASWHRRQTRRRPRREIRLAARMLDHGQDRIGAREVAVGRDRLMQSLVRRPADGSTLEGRGEISGAAPGNRALDERHEATAMGEPDSLVAIESDPELA